MDTTTHMSELMENILQIRFSNMELERNNCLELLELAEKNGSTYAKAFSYTYLGDYYLSQSDAVKSGQYLHWAHELCLEHDYEALNMKVCHLLGFFYHIIYDEQNALQYYLEALALGHKRDDIQQICNTWNNIADMFQSHGSLEEAKAYYTRAYDMMIDRQCKDSRLLLMILHNLAESTGLSGDAEGMEKYLALGESIDANSPAEKSLNQLNMLSGRCIQAALRNDLSKAVEIAQHILELGLHKLEDRYFTMELLLPVGQALVYLGESHYSKRYISILTEYSSLNETNFAQRLLRLRTLYAETFCDSAACAESYKDYYNKMKSILDVENGVRVSGMKTKIHLQEVIQQQESTQQENRRLEDAVNLDALTGIYNRRYFDYCMSEATNNYIDKQFAIIMIDIDYFKEFNDTYGHLQGDLILREIGSILNTNSSINIRPCRYGGDEFAVICYSCTDNDIEQYIIKLRNTLQALNLEHKSSGCAKQITLSLGYSNSNIDMTVYPQTIIANADRALYQAKTQGRNRWCKSD